jgi:hypothetical protein
MLGVRVLRLVHDADKVATFAIEGKSVSDALRAMADEIDADEFGNVRHALILLDTPDQMFMESRGCQFSRYETAGLLALAAQTVFDD